MNGGSRAESLAANDWGGGVHPYRVGHRKLGMWLFIMSDSLTFGALLIAYSYARVASVNWPTPFTFYPSIVFSSVMTLVLLSSSLDDGLCGFRLQTRQEAAPRASGSSRRWCSALTFIVLHLMEWKHLIGRRTRSRSSLPAEWAEGTGRVHRRCLARPSSASPGCTCFTSSPASSIWAWWPRG